MFWGRSLTYLMLSFSLVLVLPRGWCCILAAVATGRGDGRPACCQLAGCKPPCCQPATGQPDPRPGDSPTPPQPRPADSCPCAGRNTLLPEHADAPQADLGLGTAMPDLPTPPPACPFATPGPPGLTRPPPLHVMNCLWLC